MTTRDQSNTYTEREILAFTDMLDSSEDIEAALDGRACLFCGGRAGAMTPVGVVDRVQVFAHSEESGCDDV